MKRLKFNQLVTILKICLLLSVVIGVFEEAEEGISSFKDGYAHADEIKSGLSFSKESISVQPIHDSIISLGNDYAITGISSFQIQERNNVQHTTAYYFYTSLTLIISVVALIFLVLFLINAFRLLNQFEERKILEKDNLELLNKVGYNLLFFGIVYNVFAVLNNIYFRYFFSIAGYHTQSTDNYYFNIIILSLILLLISRIISFAQEIKEENDLTV